MPGKGDGTAAGIMDFTLTDISSMALPYGAVVPVMEAPALGPLRFDAIVCADSHPEACRSTPPRRGRRLGSTQKARS